MVEKNQPKSKTMEQSYLAPLLASTKAKNTEFRFTMHAWHSKKLAVGIQIRHPFICAKCRRFKINGFHGSFPPRNFCICSNASQTQSPCLSPIQLRMPSAPQKYLVATGKAVYSKTSEFSMTDSAFSKLSHILQGSKPKISIENPGPSEGQNEIKESAKEGTSEKLRYLVYPGNNSKLIRIVMQQKNNWVEGNYLDPNSAHFIWHPTSKTVKFRRLASYLPPQAINHFEFHGELTNKANLFQNLSKYCIANSLQINSMMPITFILDLNSNRLNTQVSTFLSYFKTIQGEKSPRLKGNSETALNQSMPPDTHFTGKNTWIIKPSGYNRGRGIHIFNDPDALKHLLSAYISKKREKKKQPSQGDSNTFVIQKYIEKPLLIDDRKFDVRVWVLITHKLNCYFFNEGYLRTSSEAYSNDESTFKDPIVHLTNNAIQKEGLEYGRYENGNQLSFKSFQSYLDQKFPSKLKIPDIILKFKEIISNTLLSVKKKLNPYNRENCFEIFGYDFIIDSDLQPWLIECNTNPCIELSSPLLEGLIPQMLSQAFDLTLDLIFPAPHKNPIGCNWDFLLCLQ